MTLDDINSNWNLNFFDKREILEKFKDKKILRNKDIESFLKDKYGSCPKCQSPLKPPMMDSMMDATEYICTLNGHGFIMYHRDKEKRLREL